MLISSEQKKKCLETFNKIKLYLERRELNELENYMQNLNENKIIKEFNKKIIYNQKINYPKGQLENSKDRLTFLNNIITNHNNKEYNPIKNFMQNFKMKGKLIQEKRNREREKKLNFLRYRELKKEKNQLNQTVRIIREKNRQDTQKNKNQSYLDKSTIILENINQKTPQEERIEYINFKDGEIEENMDIIKSGLYKLPKYNKAIIFKFNVDFNNPIKNKVFDLIDSVGDLLLHINIRKNETSIVLNSQIDNIWGKEIRIKRVLENIHTFKILVKNDFYKILDNDDIVTFFIRRKNTNVCYISFNDVVKEFMYKVM